MWDRITSVIDLWLETETSEINSSPAGLMREVRSQAQTLIEMMKQYRLRPGGGGEDLYYKLIEYISN